MTKKLFALTNVKCRVTSMYILVCFILQQHSDDWLFTIILCILELLVSELHSLGCHLKNDIFDSIVAVADLGGGATDAPTPSEKGSIVHGEGYMQMQSLYKTLFVFVK